MTFNATHAQGRVPVTILALNGRINMGNAGELEKQIQSLYQQGARDLLIDFTQVDSITSAGLRVLLTTARLFDGETSSNAKSAHVKLLCPTPQVEQVLEIAGFTDLLEIYESEPKAIASF